MPKAPSTTAFSARPSLRRNQACRSCRKRKLRCDAARPHCGTCVKQWQSSTSVPAPLGYAHPSEPQCIYDPVDGLALVLDTDPMEKIRMLEEEVAKLRIQLQEQNSCRPGSASSSSASSSQTSATSSSQSPESCRVTSRTGTDAVPELIYSGWNPDLPEPHVLDHYIEVFFKCDPCGPRILHRPSFLSAMRLPPRDHDFPHSAILHAICASAARWSSHNVTLLPDGSWRDEFAEYHASKTRLYIDKTMVTGEDIFPVVQACILLSWYFYREGRWVEIWTFAGFQTRIAVPLRLNHPGTFSMHSGGSPAGYLPPPRGFRDIEIRRRTWWMAVIFDRIVSIGGWIHAIDEKYIGTELPLRGEDFDGEHLIPSNPQDMSTEEIFTTHLPRYTDSFLLLIKAVMMFGRVTDFNVQGNLRAPTTPNKHQDPFALEGFSELDHLVCHDFLEKLPHSCRFNVGVTDVSGRAQCVDTDLYMVHLIPHAATITLHIPYIDLNDLHRASTERCINAAQEILSAYYMLSATSLDLTRLHPLVVICWYLAAVVRIHVCRHFIEIGDHVREAQVWGEINVLRDAMLSYGARSPIGIRQEKLLQGLLEEIIRLTTQKNPLDVGLPLYPFSHATLFASPTIPLNDAPMAPLPNTESFSQCDGVSHSRVSEIHSGPAAFSTVPSSSLYHYFTE